MTPCKQSHWISSCIAGFPQKMHPSQSFKTWEASHFLGLTACVIKEYFPESDETQKGNMKQQQQNMWSQKMKDDDNMSEDLEMKRPIEHKQNVYDKVYDATKRYMYTATGWFPVTSSRGHKYIMVAVEMDGNYIDTESLKLRSKKDLTKAYQSVWTLGSHMSH